jgi:hypothetical protein
MRQIVVPDFSFILENTQEIGNQEVDIRYTIAKLNRYQKPYTISFLRVVGVCEAHYHWLSASRHIRCQATAQGERAVGVSGWGVLAWPGVIVIGENGCLEWNADVCERGHDRPSFSARTFYLHSLTRVFLSSLHTFLLSPHTRTRRCCRLDRQLFCSA